MTWIIGGSTIFGYGVVVSDVCVTDTSTGKSWDVLQKAFPLGKFIVGGLAGDIGTGLTMLRSLHLFVDGERPPKDECWEPEYVAEHWSKRAKALYADIAANEKTGAVHVLTVGVSPRAGALGGAIPVVSVFKSPEFIPETVVGGNKFLSIGSGAAVERYRESLERLFQVEDLVYLQGEVGSPGGFGKVFANMISMEATRNPQPGISQDFHYFCVRLGRIEEFHPDGMPDVAKNWPELLTKIQDQCDTSALVAGIS